MLNKCFSGGGGSLNKNCGCIKDIHLVSLVFAIYVPPSLMPFLGRGSKNSKQTLELSNGLKCLIYFL